MRDRALNIIVSALFIFLVIGLVYTQVLKFSHYSALSKNNSIRIISIDGPRGRIFDRNKIPLAANRLSFDAAVIYQELKDKDKLIRILGDITGISRRDVMKSLEAARLKPYAPVTILEDVEKEKALILEEASFDVDGLVIETRSRRQYLYNEAGSHLFGYLSEIGNEELESLRDYGYHIKDLVGRSGLEKYYQTYLAGTDGGMQIEVDNRGRQTKILGIKEPSHGKDLYLTVDISLQIACDRLLGEHNGAIIVMNPKNGEILALASHPAFDPNIFVKPGTSGERLRLLRDEKGLPLLNRAISGVYPPGSVFKVVVATGALETKKISGFTRFFCQGSYKLGSTKFDCWKEEGHGSQDITDALMNSCNVFFYQTGRTMGADNIEACAKLFGFGRPTGIDLPDEARGLVPGRLWKRLYKKDNWYEGDTLNYAIGQGYLLVTPIQILEMMAVMANKGNMVQPHIVKRIDSTLVSNVKMRSLGLKSDVLQSVRRGLFNVVNGEAGTGKRAKTEGVAAAGKTGTAENPQGKTHGWFGGFAPYDDPKICLVVFLEHGGKGGLQASEIARGIFETAKAKGYL